MTSSTRAELFFGAASGLALSVLLWATFLYTPPLEAGPLLLVALAAAAGSASRRVPRLGRVSAIYPVALAGLLLHGPGLSLVCATACAVIECRVRTLGGRRRKDRGLVYEVARVTLSAASGAIAFAALGGKIGPYDGLPPLPALAGHAVTFALGMTILGRLGLRVEGRKSPVGILAGFAATLPGYLVGIATAVLVAWIWLGPQAPMLVAFVALLSMTSGLFRAGESRRRLQHLHRSDVKSICRSVSQALAKTVEARDEGTREHLHRVQRLSLCVGDRLGLAGADREALEAAALLHDIGKIAVPEGILTKPGRLTPTEMERIKIHPAVGAEILQSIPFPYPLAPIVRHHHERWDGRGYPNGLEGEAIPLGARILAVVDSYDALTSDRPYRKALPDEEAVGFLLRESGSMFDPDAVDALIEHLDGQPRGEVELEAEQSIGNFADEPDAEERAAAGNLPLAQRELQTLYDISRAMSYDLDFDEYLTLVGCKLAAIVPYQSLVVYVHETEERLLRACFAMGKASDKLRLMTIPVGERLSGWSAQQQRAFIGHDHMSPLERDGSRSDLEDWIDDDEVGSLQSTLVAPMVAGEHGVGVMTLYDHAERRFTADDRRILIRVAGYVAQVARRLGGRPTIGDFSLTDPLTGVPNARFLWLESAHRMSQNAEATNGFGLLAFRISGLEQVSERLGNECADRLLCQIARRFAAGCRESETLVRFGQDLFMVLTPAQRSGELVQRWHELAAEIEHPPIEAVDGVVHRARLTAAHAAFPSDGPDLESLLRVIDTRLSLSVNGDRTIVPFRAPRAFSEVG